MHCNHRKFRLHKSHLWNHVPRWLKHFCTTTIYKLKINEEACLKIDSSYPWIQKYFKMSKGTTWLCSPPQWQISCITARMVLAELTFQCVGYFSCIPITYLKNININHIPKLLSPRLIHFVLFQLKVNDPEQSNEIPHDWVAKQQTQLYSATGSGLFAGRFLLMLLAANAKK